ncbi:hypothetical protein AAC387_Pa03g2054 [Persea americana]
MKYGDVVMNVGVVNVFKWLNDPLESMEAQGCAREFNLRRKKGLQKKCQKGSAFLHSPSQAAAHALERTRLLPGVDPASVWRRRSITAEPFVGFSSSIYRWKALEVRNPVVHLS